MNMTPRPFGIAMLIGAGIGISACTPQPLVERESAIVELNRPAYVVMENAPLGPVALPASCVREASVAETGATPSTPMGCSSILALDAGLYRPEDRFNPRRPGPARARTVTSPVYNYLGSEPGIGGFSAGSRRQSGRVESIPQDAEDSEGASGASNGEFQ